MDTVRASFGASVAFVVEWRTFMIDPGTAAGGEDYLAYNRRRWGGDGWTHELRVRGASAGAPFARWQWWPNTLRAHALAHCVRARYGAAAEDALTQLLMEITYERGGNVSSPAVLAAAVAELAQRVPACGIDVAAVQAAVRAGAGVDEARAEDRAVKRAGVGGVPLFRISCAGIVPRARPVTLSGCQPVRAFLRVFERIISAAK